VGMQSILQWSAAAPHPVGTMVYTSSTSVYPQDRGTVVDETADAPGATPNGATIRQSEVLLQHAPAEAVARAFILRLAGIYGPGRHHLLDHLRAGTPTLNGDGTPRLNLAHRDDIVAAILACLGAPAEMRSEVVAWLAQQLGRPVPVFDGSTTARRGGAPMPDRIISAAKIQRMLGWQPRYPDFRGGFGAILSGGNSADNADGRG